MGRGLELGGTWVHWVQPHVWAEMTRYGIGVVAGPEFEKAYWWADGQRHEGPAERVLEIIDEPNKRLLEQTRELIPLPYQPLSNPAVKGVDPKVSPPGSTRSTLNEEARQLLRTFWSLNFNGKIEDAAFTQALRWCSAASGDWMLMFEACATYKVAGRNGCLSRRDPRGHNRRPAPQHRRPASRAKRRRRHRHHRGRNGPLRQGGHRHVR